MFRLYGFRKWKSSYWIMYEVVIVICISGLVVKLKWNFIKFYLLLLSSKIVKRYIQTLIKSLIFTDYL